MSVGRRSNEELMWKPGELGSAIGIPRAGRDDGVRSKDMARVLDALSKEGEQTMQFNQEECLETKEVTNCESHENGFQFAGAIKANQLCSQSVETARCKSKQSCWTRVLKQCLVYKKSTTAFAVIASLCVFQVQAYYTETVDGITWKYEVSGGGCSLYGAGDTVYDTVRATTIPQDTSGDIVIPSSLGGYPVVGIMNFAFAHCVNITSVIIPDSVTTVGVSAFKLCKNLEKVVFGKNMKTIYRGALCVKEANSSEKAKLKTIIARGPTIGVYNGYDMSVVHSGISVTVYANPQYAWPDVWCSSCIVKYYDPIPEIGSAVAKNLNEALCYFADNKLKRQIDSIDKYNSFRAWANGISGTSDMAKRQSIVDSSLSWLSFALDAEALIGEAPKQGDLSVDQFEPADEDGAFALTCSLSGITIGENATAANLAEVFGIEGAAELNESAFSSEGLTVNLQRTADGKAKATVTPEGMPPSFFMRVKIK